MEKRIKTNTNSTMKIIPQSIPEILLFQPEIIKEERGFFVETMRRSFLSEAKLPNLIQHNQSRSKFGVLRGLHYQLDQPQGKLVRCSYGKVFDVAVDIRKSSPTFGKSVTKILDDLNHEQLWIPKGFAHGFMVLSEFADFCYFCSDYYNPKSQHGIAWDDPYLNISWPKSIPKSKIILSSKDKNNSKINEKDGKDLFP